MNERSLRLPDSSLLLLTGASFLLFLLPGVLGSYGRFIDEFYYLACAERLAWGYVDHPPLAPAMLAANRALLGDSLLALRILPALIGAATVAGTGLLARRLGASPFGQLVAGAAILIASVPQIFFGMFSMNALGLALWLAACWVLVEIEARDEPRLWLAFGALSGIALLNKHTFVLLAVGLALALPWTPARRHLRSPWLWAGAALALAMLAPNLLWQAQHGWPSLEFYRNADLYKNEPTPWWAVALFQVLVMNPGTLPLWLLGLYFLLRVPSARQWRHVGLACAILFVLMVASEKSRPDRITGIYPVLFAAGGMWLDRLTADRRRWLRPVAVAWMALCGLVLLPIGSPVLPPEMLSRYAGALGVVPQIESGEGKTSPLPQWFADRLEWEAFVEDVDRALVAADFPTGAKLAIVAPSYGQAGALEHFRGGPEFAGFPSVHSDHNSYFLWGPPDDDVDGGLVIGGREEELRELFEEVSLLDRHECAYCMRWRDRMPIWKVWRPRVPLSTVWERFRHFG